ncbi:hypothetical protein BASA62_001921 [Batrachochytrium salamandrivorans]|nr:hypothetical protein BASA62_001921 [Batrachochytrium salamandrivorans]
MDRIERVMRKYQRDDIPKIEWMDQLAFCEIERINRDESTALRNLYLYIDLPQFDFPVVFNEKEYRFSPNVIFRSYNSDLAPIFDPESLNENPVENKHRKLARSHRKWSS